MHKARACFFVCAGIFLLALPVPMALAGGVNINWGTGCWSDGAPLNLLAFACNTNIFSSTMTSSFAVSQDHPDFYGVEIHLVGQMQAGTIPSWWQMDLGECREGALSVSQDFTSAPRIGCVDPWENLGASGYVYSWSGNSARLVVVVAVDQPVPITAGVEYYAARMRISHIKTVGTGACAGCSKTMVWRLDYLQAVGSTWYEKLTTALPGGNQLLWWQQYTAGVDPALNTTWGQVKGLYR
jgi:hypothetical protein